MIPKIIHQTWKDENIPDKWKESVNSCKTLYSDFTYMLWTDEMMKEFISKEYPWFYDTYMSYPHQIQRCDAFRYFVLYKYGGVYFDMDIMCLKKLSSFLKYDAIVSKSFNVSSLYTNMFFAFSKQNTFLKFCVDNLQKYKNSHSKFGKHLHVMNSTGPSFMSNMIEQYGELDNVYVLSKQEFSGDCTVCNTEKGCQGGDYFKHVQGSSWIGWDSQLYNFIFCNHKTLLLLLLFTIVYLFVQ
jgi:mannosyltransferase OCH1-like enzyme